MHAKRLFLLMAALVGSWLLVGLWAAAVSKRPPPGTRG